MNTPQSGYLTPPDAWNRRNTPWLLAALLLTALLHLGGFDGFWISDDFGNIHQLFSWDENGQLWAGLAEKMVDGNTPAGAFYRPGIQLVRGLLWPLAGAQHAGWFTAALLLHLCNTALVMSLVIRLAGSERDVYPAAALAGLLFGASPIASEGVFWIAAGADGWVTLLVLLTLHAWYGSATRWVPLLFVVALAFKESAAVLPLQLLVLRLVPKRDGLDGSRTRAVVTCLALLAAWFLLRASLFDEAWRVYTDGPAPSLASALGSIPAWWRGLNAEMGALPGIYLLLLVSSAVLGITQAWTSRAMPLVLALGIASGGLCLATLLNLGGLLPDGEGGRLLLTPMAWLALAAGISLCGDRAWLRYAAQLAMVLTVIAGGLVLVQQYRQAAGIQSTTRQLVASLPEWAAQHAGSTVLILPEGNGRLPVFRNAQSGLVMPPLQAEPLLHRIVPTLEKELPARHGHLANGLLNRIDLRQPHYVDWRVVVSLLQPAPPRWPDHYACWSWQSDGIRPLQAPARTTDAQDWVSDLAAQAREACGIQVTAAP